MRKRFPILLAANGRWPDAGTGGIGFTFTWAKIDNRGSNPVTVGLNANVTAGDLMDSYMTVAGGKVRVFNLSGPKHTSEHQDQLPTGENAVNQIYLVSALGTTLFLEVADYPIVDMVFAT